MDLNEHKEPKSVPLTNTVANPWAMMIMGSHTMVTLFAVLAAEGLLDVTDCAILVLDEQDDILLI